MKANVEIKIPVVGGGFETVYKDDFLILDSITTTSVYLLHVNVSAPQDGVKIECSGPDVERVTKILTACKDVTTYDTQDELALAMQAVRDSVREQTSKPRKVVQEPAKPSEKKDNKENIFKCVAVAALICAGIYIIAKK